MNKFKLLFLAAALLSQAAIAKVPKTVRLECDLRMPADNHLQEIPQFKFEIADWKKGRGYILIQTPLRPVGATPVTKVLEQFIGDAYVSKDGAMFYITDRIENEISGILTTRWGQGLLYYCSQPCYSGHYNPKDHTCEFPDSLAPEPLK